MLLKSTLFIFCSHSPFFRCKGTFDKCSKQYISRYDIRFLHNLTLVRINRNREWIGYDNTLYFIFSYHSIFPNRQSIKRSVYTCSICFICHDRYYIYPSNNNKPNRERFYFLLFTLYLLPLYHAIQI